MVGRAGRNGCPLRVRFSRKVSVSRSYERTLSDSETQPPKRKVLQSQITTKAKVQIHPLYTYIIKCTDSY